MEIVFQTIPVINLHRCHWIWRTWLNIEMFTHSNFRIHTFSRTKSINGLHTDCNALVVEKLSRVFSELSRFEVNDTRWSALPPTRMTLNAPLAKSKLPSPGWEARFFHSLLIGCWRSFKSTNWEIHLPLSFASFPLTFQTFFSTSCSSHFTHTFHHQISCFVSDVQEKGKTFYWFANFDAFVNDQWALF